MAASPIRVVVVEDQKTTREGLTSLISGTPGFVVAGGFDAVEGLITLLERPARGAVDPDVVLLDIQLAGMTGLEGVRRLRALRPGLLILMLTVYDDNDRIFEAICGGACGYLLKDTPPERLIGALREAQGGGAPMSPEVARKVVTMFQRAAPPRQAEHRLSPREMDVLRLLADGHSYKTAAAALSLSEDTIRFHIRHVYEKLHVHSKSEAVVKALREGLLR